jgi:predicted dienelactone hydrolase
MKMGGPFLRGAFLFLVGIAVLMLTATAGLAGQEIKAISTRPGVTVQVLLNTPATPPKGIVVMFPGGGGAAMFKGKGGQIHLGRNFLVRTSPKFVQQGWAVAIVDAPSDQANGMSDWFRNSPEHVQDIRKVIDYLDSRGLKPLYLVGTSRGTLSVAYLGIELQDPRVKGLVLTSTLGGSQFVGGLPLDRIRLRVLLVHHRDDGCKVCPFQEAVALKGKLSGSPKVDFVEVQGGSPPQSGPCRTLSYHGFLGREDQVVQVMADWLAGKQVPAQIGN